MIKNLLFFLGVLFSLSMYSQDNKDIARIYLQKATASYEGRDLVKATDFLEKAVKYLEGINSEEVAVFGTRLYVEKKQFRLAQTYAKQFFVLSKSKKSKEYRDMLLQYVDIKDAVDKLDKIEAAKIKDSTKTKEVVVVEEVKKAHPQFTKAQEAFKARNYILAKVALDAYFLEVKDKTTKEYTDVLNFFVQVKEKLEAPTVEETDLVKKDSIAIPKQDSVITTGPVVNDLEIKKDSVLVTQDTIKIDEPTTNFVIDEKAAVYPGCSGDNEALKACMEKSLKDFFTEKFDVKLAAELKLESGTQKIFTVFTLARDGSIGDVKIRAPHAILEEEVKRVIQLLPKIEPASQRGEAIPSTYTIPIFFRVE